MATFYRVFTNTTAIAMGKKNKAKQNKTNSPQPPAVKKLSREKKTSLLPWILLVMGITALCLSPMLKNGFTNWDDEFYVIKNQLLRGPDWKGIFSQPVVGNYHPLTIITLAFNYGLTQLDASSYLLFNYLLHLINTALVFYFIYCISDKKMAVAILTALIFGIHPMHVESVAWVSERKDVLYTFFFMLSLLQYWRFLIEGKRSGFWLCFLFFLFSLLSKPAAIILPVVLLFLDYWKGRPITRKVIFEKIPFFVFALLFAVITLKIQSTSAVVKLESYPLWSRPLFACYVYMIYFLRFIVPYPLATFHPYPPIDHLGWPILISPLFIIALIGFIWYNRKNKVIVFGFLFFAVNLLLVAQVVSIGSSIVSERYTYVPYIGIAFMLSMWISRLKGITSKRFAWITVSVITVAFGFITFRQTGVWKDSATLWTNVINYYPSAAIPRTNRANHSISRAVDPANKDIPAANLYQQALEDCNVALLNKPGDVDALANRQNIYLNLNRDTLALADANALIKVKPDNKTGYYTRSVVYSRFNQPEKALMDINKSISIDSIFENSFVQRAFLYYNYFQKYTEALLDYDRAIQLNPQGQYYLNRAYCYYKLGDPGKARAEAQMAMSKGITISEDFRKAISL
jgi:protein O-mannosyl-transferase